MCKGIIVYTKSKSEDYTIEFVTTTTVEGERISNKPVTSDEIQKTYKNVYKKDLVTVDVSIFHIHDWLNNAVVVDKNNPSIERVEGCINCGMCARTCKLREGMDDNEKYLTCLGCGQCIITCPKKVLQPKNDIHKITIILSIITSIAYYRTV